MWALGCRVKGLELWDETGRCHGCGASAGGRFRPRGWRTSQPLAPPAAPPPPCTRINTRLTRCVVVTEAGSYLRLIDFCIPQLKAQGPSRTCNESKEEEEEELSRGFQPERGAS